MIRLFHLHPYKKHQISEKLLSDLNKGKHPYANFPIYPKPYQGVKFEESLFIDNFLNVADKYCEISNDDNFALVNLVERQMMSLIKLMELERNHTDELSELAVKIVTEYFNLDNEFDFDAKIGPTPSSISNEMELKPKLQKPNIPGIDTEVQKRKIINAIQQGSALKTSRLYEMYKNDLDSINPELFNLSKELIEVSYLIYYLTEPEVMAEMHESIKNSNNPQMQEEASKLINAYKLKFNGERVTLYARGVVFITLLHELIKGVVEILSLPALPKDKVAAEYVIDQADNLICEHYGLILGPKIWEEFNKLVPYDDENIKSLIFSRLFSLPTDELMVIFEKLFNNISLVNQEEEPIEIPEVKEVIDKLKHDIYVYENELEYQDTHNNNNDDNYDEDVDSLFR